MPSIYPSRSIKRALKTRKFDLLGINEYVGDGEHESSSEGNQGQRVYTGQQKLAQTGNQVT